MNTKLIKENEYLTEASLGNIEVFPKILLQELSSTMAGIYGALILLRGLSLNTDFPIDRKKLYEKYCVICRELTVTPLKPNDFAFVLKTFYLDKSYIVEMLTMSGHSVEIRLRKLE